MAEQESILSFTQPVGAAPAAPTAGLPATFYPMYVSKEKSGCGGMEIALCVLLLLFIIWIIMYMSPARVLTRRLVRAGWVLYVRPGCGHCVRQEAILHGKFWKKVACLHGKVVSSYTSTPPIPCEKATAVPLWYNTRTSKSVVGVQSWAQLQKMAK